MPSDQAALRKNAGLLARNVEHLLDDAGLMDILFS
jgi:hypothetical protein